MTLHTTAHATGSLARTIERAPDGSPVTLRLIGGSDVVGTVEVVRGGELVKDYRVTAGSITWTVPAEHVVAVGIPA